MRDAVIARIDGMRRCTRLAEHEALQRPTAWGELTVSESLNPDDYVYYERCGLCAGFRRWITRQEYDNAERRAGR